MHCPLARGSQPHSPVRSLITAASADAETFNACARSIR